MRELRRADVADAVADRPDAAHVRAHPVVDDEAEALALEAGVLDAAVVRDAARSEKDLVAFDRLRLPIDLVGHRDGPALACDLSDLRVRLHLDALGRERSHEQPDELGVRVADRLRQHLEHRDLRADLGVERAELHPDRAAADDDEPLRDLGEAEGADVVERLRVREPLDRRHADLRARRDDDGVRLHRPLAVAGLHLELAGRREGAAAGYEVDLAALEQQLDAADQLLHDGILARDGLWQSERRALEHDPVLFAVRREPVRVNGIEERFRRDASDGHADPADAIPLDERDPRALRRGVEGGDVATGPAAEDRDVVALLAHSPNSLAAPDASRSSGCAR